MENRIKLREAIAQCQVNGRMINKGELADKLFPSKSHDSSSVIFYKYLRGASVKIDRVTIDRICKELDTTPNKLFGHE